MKEQQQDNDQSFWEKTKRFFGENGAALGVACVGGFVGFWIAGPVGVVLGAAAAFAGVKDISKDSEHTTLWGRFKNFLGQHKNAIAGMFGGMLLGFAIGGPIGMAVGAVVGFGGVKYQEHRSKKKQEESYPVDKVPTRAEQHRPSAARAHQRQHELNIPDEESISVPRDSRRGPPGPYKRGRSQ